MPEEEELPKPARRILFVAPRFHTNQVGVIEALKRKGHEVHFHGLLVGHTEDHSLLTPQIFAEGWLSSAIQRVFGPGGENRLRGFPPIFSYFKALRDLNPDLIIVRDPRRYFSLLAAILGWLLGARIVFYKQFPHQDEHPFKRAALINLLSFFFNAAWLTPIAGEYGRPKLPHTYFVPFAVSGTPKERPFRVRKLVLMVAKYQTRKRHDLFVEAIYRLRDRGVVGIIAGECETPEQTAVRQGIAKRISELDAECYFRFVGKVPYRRMGTLYRCVDLMVLPSEREPASVAVLEAIAHGTPAICADDCGTRFYVEDGHTGAIFRTGDVRDLSRAIEQCFESDKHLREMQENCREYAHRNLSADAYYKLFSDMVLGRWPAEKGLW